MYIIYRISTYYNYVVYITVTYFRSTRRIHYDRELSDHSELRKQNDNKSIIILRKRARYCLRVDYR